MHLKIGTRGSKLALAQSAWVKGQIEEKYPDVRVTLVKIKTKGDRILDAPLSKIGGKGLFVKEIEEALLRGEVDLAVHSVKDVPGEIPEGLVVSVFPEREDPCDAFISLDYGSLTEVPRGARVGTGSLRRSAQLLHMRPDIEIVGLRGNVDTRLRKLKEEGLQAVILAAAGLKRLGLSDRIRLTFSPNEFLPAVGQGALGLELRRDDDRVWERLRFLNHEETGIAVRAERAFLKTLEGGCQVPIAGFGRLEEGRLILEGMVAELDGTGMIRHRIEGDRERPEDLGRALGEHLLSSGADRILDRIYEKG
ncbi:MAG: hydroxymethylbilane synthase [Desulfatiglandales bacterium]